MAQEKKETVHKKYEITPFKHWLNKNFKNLETEWNNSTDSESVEEFIKWSENKFLEIEKNKLKKPITHNDKPKGRDSNKRSKASNDSDKGNTEVDKSSTEPKEAQNN